MSKFEYQPAGFVLLALLVAAGFYFSLSRPVLALEAVVYVDDDFTALDAGGDTWGVDAFNTVTGGIAAVAVDGTVNVAPGTYISGAPITLTKRFNLIGPGKDAPVPALIVSNACTRVLNIQTSGIVVRGLHFKETNAGGTICTDFPNVRITGAGGLVTTGIVFDDNELIGGQNSLSVRFDTRETTVSNNRVHDSFAYGMNIASAKDSEIYGNESYNNIGGMLLQSGRQSGDAPSGLDDSQFTGTIIYDNNFHDNETGMDLDLGDQTSAFTIGPDNIFTENDYGITIVTSGNNIFFAGNKIYDNTLGGINAVIDEDTDMEKNYWGAADGPFHSVTNPDGSGNGLIGPGEVNVIWRPYYMDTNLTTLSSVTVDAEDLDLLFENGGTLYFEGASLNAASEIEANEDFTVNVPAADGISSIELTEETEITETNDNLFDATLLSASEVPVVSLAGITAGTPVPSALQWGIPNLELTFSQPITINLFVSEKYNDETLQVQRSTTGTDGWTSAGLVEQPTTCVVSAGVCTFQSNKASYFVALLSANNHSRQQEVPQQSDEVIPGEVSREDETPGDNNPLSDFPKNSSPDPVTEPENKIPMGLKYGIKDEAVKQLQMKLKDLGFFPRSIEPTGWFGPITQKAVKDFQITYNLPATGQFDQLTWYFWMTFFD